MPPVPPAPTAPRRAGDSRAAANAAAVLRTVLDHGPVARSAVSGLCGLSPAAVSRQTTGLLRRGLLREVPAPPAGPTTAAGRPRIPLDLHTGAAGGPVAGALQIGVRASILGLVDLRGRVLARRTWPHEEGLAPDRLTARIAAELSRFLADSTAGRPLLGVGAALGGWVRPDAGLVVRHEALGWRDVALGAALHEALGVPVRVDNHARAVGHAEILFGHPGARRSLVHLFIGNVVDAAFAIVGAVHQGPGAAAGDVAHLPVPGSAVRCPCGRTGCLQGRRLRHGARRRGRAPGDRAGAVRAAAGGRGRHRRSARGPAAAGAGPGGREGGRAALRRVQPGRHGDHRAGERPARGLSG
ncbi:ROK family protein [Streptomyces sp. G-G2]|uniref:ROK family protein n=1 Tax=Streptomyces sp. G-G2 TaxID=3046201 RepID=UPI0032D99FB9